MAESLVVWAVGVGLELGRCLLVEGYLKGSKWKMDGGGELPETDHAALSGLSGATDGAWWPGGG